MSFIVDQLTKSAADCINFESFVSLVIVNNVVSPIFLYVATCVDRLLIREENIL